MDYAKAYDILIERARNRTLTVYTERHHIIPRCIGGTDDEDNLVKLTPEEHFMAHKLLVKIHPENWKLAFALLGMGMNSRGTRPNNKIFGWARRRVAIAARATRKGRARPQWIMQRLREANTGRPLKQSHRDKIAASNRGQPHSVEHNAKVSAALKGRGDIGMFGKHHSEETKAKMRAAALDRKHTPETIDKLTMHAAGLTQEERSARAYKAWETKRRKSQLATNGQPQGEPHA